MSLPNWLPFYQVDAFTSRRFAGNPAAVCPLPEWPDDALMQAIAAENNLSETAFFVPENEGWRIRWFTPQAEIDLCGHATLASACGGELWVEDRGDRVIIAGEAVIVIEGRIASGVEGCSGDNDASCSARTLNPVC